MSIYSKTACYAVLASLSGRYPPLEGRSPTCYSPVCHSITHCWALAFDLHVLGTPPALILSQDQTLMLNSLTAVTPGRRCAVQLFNARPIGSALFNPLLVRGSQPVAVARTEKPRSTDSAAPRADSHCPASSLNCSSGSAETGLVCACTHYLVFKEPTAQDTRGALPLASVSAFVWGDFQSYQTVFPLVNNKFTLPVKFCWAVPGLRRRWCVSPGHRIGCCSEEL